MQKRPQPPNRNMVNLMLDTAILLGFLVVMAPRFSGVSLHEWLGVSFGAAIIAHILLHWQWVVEITKRFLSGAQTMARINYLVNMLLFIDVTIIIFTGLMFSESVTPLFGLHIPNGRFWQPLHSLSARLSVVPIGLHIALHWQWFVNAFKRYAVAPLLPAPPAQIQATPKQAAKHPAKEVAS
jgi:hypothetical protein